MMIRRIIGIDPGLNNTGWGVIETGQNGFTFAFVAAGIIHSDKSLTLAERLAELHKGLAAVIEEFKPDEAAVEETFVNVNPASTLKLGQARGVALLTPALFNVPVSEYAPNKIKKAIVGVGHAEKTQVDMMVKSMLKGLDKDVKMGADAADALAIALCHGYNTVGALGGLMKENKKRQGK